MIKLVNILNEIGDASKAFDTQIVGGGKQIWYKINDENFPFDNFWISVSIGDKEDIIDNSPDSDVKPRFNLSKNQGNAAAIAFGIVENNQWYFPEINKGYLFGIMGTVVNSIKDVLDKVKSIEYLLFTPASKIKSATKTVPNKRFNLSKNLPPQENTQVSDNGAQREKLYLAYTRKQFPNSVETKENGWNVIQIKNTEINESDPKVGTGKKPKGSGRRLYTDENPKDTVRVKFKTAQDIKDTLSKETFKSKPHARQSQVINLIHQRVRAAYNKAKDPEVKSRLKRALDYIEKRKEASKEKTKRLKND
jgi:hypothetical protein